MKQMTPTTLIVQGLDLEEQQYVSILLIASYLTDSTCRRRLIYDHGQLGKHPTSLQLAKVVEHATNLCSRIEAWIVVQALYMPVTTVLRVESENRPRM